MNFNYKHTNELYRTPVDHFIPEGTGKVISVSSIHIHGTIDKNESNPIIFGCGDELDDDYKLVEKQANEYLENIKSILYLDSDNYKKLLVFINSDMFQVFIMGHSCGISDRTLLNTIFEHDNCASVKVFFHQIDDKRDNFSDVVRNISRNFSDKAKMRDRVVNKKYSKPLVPFSNNTSATSEH